MSSHIAPYRLTGGSGNGCDGWNMGQVVRANEHQRAKGFPEYLFVIEASQRYVAEDGLSLGVGADRGYLFYASCREATDDEAAPIKDKYEAAERKRQVALRTKRLAKQVQEMGERPEGSFKLNGERLLDSQTLYGGGSWWVISDEHIWFVRNNGADGDDWSHNNVETGGAGAIGWRVPRSAELEAELRSLANGELGVEKEEG